MDPHAPVARGTRAKTEDLRVFLVLGIPIFVVTVSLITLILNFGPGHGQ